MILEDFRGNESRGAHEATCPLGGSKLADAIIRELDIAK